MEIGGGGGGFTKAKKMFKESIKLNRIYLGGGGGGERRWLLEKHPFCKERGLDILCDYILLITVVCLVKQHAYTV